MESLTADAPGFVNIVSVVELVWVLSGCYGSTKGEICEILTTLLRTKELVVAQADTVWQALRSFRDSKADFADCLIERTANAVGCSHTATFDREAAKGCGMKLLE